MRENQIVTTKIFREMNEQDRSVLYRNKNRDNFSNNLYYKTFSLEDITNSIKEFNRMTGVVNDGLRVSISGSTPYFKAFTDIKLPPKYRKKGQVQDLIPLLEQETRAISVYINGKKIPDNVIKLYVSVNGTDVFIPYAFFDINKPFDLFIEDLLFRDKEYIHTYIPNNTSNRIIIDLNGNDNFFDYKSFDKNKLMIYANGYLISENFKAHCNKDEKTIIIDSLMSIGKDIEILYNHFISYKKVTEGKLRGKQFYFKIDKPYQNLIYGPIPKRSCLFFRNGVRCKQQEIKQISRQLFLMEFEEEVNFSNLILYIQDINRTNDKDFISYNSDYYFQKMLGEDRIIKGLEGRDTGTAFDDFKNEFSYHEVFNNNGNRYDDKLADDYIFRSTNEAANSNYTDKLKELFHRNPSIMRELLRKFGRTIYSYIVTKTEEDFVVSAKTIPPDNKELSIDIFLNWEHLEPENYKVDVLNNVYTITIPKELLKDKFNFIEINENVVSKDFTKIKFLEFEPGNIGIPDSKDYKGTLVIPRNIIEEYTSNIDHMIFLEFIKDEPGYIYMNKFKSGYKKLDGVEIDITESNYRFNFKELPKKKFVLYFTNFSYKGKTRFDSSASTNGESKIFLYIGANDDPKPIVSNSLPEIYVNNKFYIYGVDYTFSTPLNNSTIAGTMISFVTPIENGDIITYSFSGLNNKSIIENKGSSFKYNSKYGLLYLSALEFPYHPDYFDLYIDGRKVFKTDIDLLSDKLLRIRNIPVPFNDIYLQTKFSYDYKELQFLFDLYKEDAWELVVEKLFKSVDPTDPEGAGDNDNYNPDDIFGDFEDDVGENPINPPVDGGTGGGKDPNPENPDQKPERQNYLLTVYLRWLLSDDARTVVFNDTYLHQKVFDYFKIYQITSNDADIIIDCDSANLQDNKNYHLKCDIPSMSISDRMNLILDQLKSSNGNKDFTLHDLFDTFINNKSSNMILPVDFPKEKDESGRYKHLSSDILFFKENSENPLIITEKPKPLELKLTFDEKNVKLTKNIYLFVSTNGSISYAKNNDNIIVNFVLDPVIGNHFVITGAAKGKSIISFIAKKEGFESIKKQVKINVIEQGRLIASETDISLFEFDEIENNFKEIEIITNLIDIDIIYDKDSLKVEYNPETSMLKVTGMKHGKSKIVLRAKEADDNWLKTEINVDVKLRPLTLLSTNITNISQFTDEPVKVITINTNADSFVYAANIATGNHSDLDIEQNGITVSVGAKSALSGNISFVAKAPNSKIARAVVPFEFKERATTKLDTDLKSIQIYEEKIINMNVYTDANTYSLNINSNDSFEVTRAGNSITLKAIKPSEGFITLSAKDGVKYEKTIEIPFRIIPMEITQLSANVSNLGLVKDQISVIEVYTNADDFSANLNSDIATLTLDKKRKRITVVAKRKGDSILTIKATASENKPNSITIPITIH